MTVLTGDITTFLAALEHTELEPEVQKIVTMLGSGYVVSEFKGGPRGPIRSISFADKGFDISIEKNTVAALHITVHASESSSHTPYLAVGSLIDGLDADSSRKEILAVLGKPIKSGKLYDLYLVDGRFIHFKFSESSQQISKITLMSNDPFASPLTDASGSSTSRHVGGTINILIAAIGHEESEPEVQAAIILLGTEYVSGDSTGGPDVKTRYLRFGEHGDIGHIQFKNDHVSNISFATGLLSFGAPVPKGLRAENFVDGFHNKPRRDDIQATLGAPYVKQKSFELYNIDGVNVHVDYIRDIPSMISVGMLPAKESYQ